MPPPIPRTQKKHANSHQEVPNGSCADLEQGNTKIRLFFSAWAGMPRRCNRGCDLPLKLPARSCGESSNARNSLSISIRSLTPQQAAGHALAVHFQFEAPGRSGTKLSARYTFQAPCGKGGFSLVSNFDSIRLFFSLGPLGARSSFAMGFPPFPFRLESVPSLCLPNGPKQEGGLP